MKWKVKIHILLPHLSLSWFHLLCLSHSLTHSVMPPSRPGLRHGHILASSVEPHTVIHCSNSFSVFCFEERRKSSIIWCGVWWRVVSLYVQMSAAVVFFYSYCFWQKPRLPKPKGILSFCSSIQRQNKIFNSRKKKKKDSKI